MNRPFLFVNIRMDFFDYKSQIDEFFRQNGMPVDPVPQVNIDWTKNGRLDPFISTGNFSHQTNTITLYVDNRQVKDILRTYAHELVHACQFHRDPETFQQIVSSGDSETITGNGPTEELESEAYAIGNVMFRKWTESQKSK